MKVCKVNVSGLRRTKNDIIVEQVKKVLQATTLEETLTFSLQSLEKLQSLNIFKNIRIHFDTCRDKVGKVEGIEVTYHVKESSRIATSLSATAGSQTGDANLSFSFRNLFGRAEQLRTVSTTAFPHWGNTIRVEFIKPHYSNIKQRLNASFGTTSYKQPSCGFEEYTIGPKLDIQCPSIYGNHTLSWLCDWRQLFGFDNVPMGIRLDAGHSLKSSIKHILETDTRDNPLLPHDGYHTKISQELAGLGGDVIFSKVEFQTEVYKEIIPNWVLSVSLWCGLLKPFISNSKINDKFLLGGPTTLRGFHMWGMGPRSQGFSLGGEAYWANGLHLYCPLPYTSGEFFRRIRIHSFITSGNLMECSKLSHLTELFQNIRVSCGIGLHVRLGVAQIELNYALPLKAQPQDWLKPGLQFGIGLDML